MRNIITLVVIVVDSRSEDGVGILHFNASIK